MVEPLLPPERVGPPLPASGGWRPGDPAGDRRFAVVNHGRPFATESGTVLGEVTVAYETWGTLSPDADNAILVCHALTGDSHAAAARPHAVGDQGWWEPIIGPGRALDTDRYFVVCSNVLGGCQGTTGPGHPHPDDGRPWGPRFPLVTIRDMVRAQIGVADHLGIDRWLSVVGGSMGGMQVLEWAAMVPHRVGSIAVIASAMEASPLQIAWSHVGREAIRSDPNWRGGWYYDAPDGQGPHVGLTLARRIAQIHYRADESYQRRFGRSVVGRIDHFRSGADRFQIEGYLDYHGDKLARRFDANSYLVVNRAMDLHDLARGRGGLDWALRRITMPALVVSIDSDMLYVPRQQQELRDALRAVGGDVTYETLRSSHGHDGFLIEFPTLAPMLDQFVAAQAKDGAGRPERPR